MKFKVGDKVRVREDLVVDRKYGGLTFVSSMKIYCGIVFTVDRILHGYVSYYELDEIPWAWTDEMLEPYNDNEEAHKFEAFLREVVDGNKPSTASTNRAYHLLYDLVNHDDGDAECYLTEEGFESAISELVDFYVNKFVPKEDEPAVEMTLSEVEKALGHKVKIINEEE